MVLWELSHSPSYQGGVYAAQWTRTTDSPHPSSLLVGGPFIRLASYCNDHCFFLMIQILPSTRSDCLFNWGVVLVTDHAVRSVRFLDYERIVTGTSDHPKIVRVRVVHWHNRHSAFAGEKNKRSTTSKSSSFIISWAESYNDRRHFHSEGISPPRNTRARNLSKIPTHWHFKCLTAGNLIISNMPKLGEGRS